MRPVARIAQSVEQGIENPRVRGSIPRPGTNILKTQPYGWVFAFWHPVRFLVALVTAPPLRETIFCFTLLCPYGRSINMTCFAFNNTPRNAATPCLPAESL